MRAAVMTAPDQLEVRDVPEPQADGRAVVQIVRAGLCGTDAKILSGGIPVSYPRVLGHEMYGRVVTAAPGGEFAQGAAVLVDPTVSCGRCQPCRRGLVHLCLRGGLMGRDLDGGFAERVAVDERQLLPVPDSVDPDEAGLLQVLGTCLHGHAKLHVEPGRPAAVIGLGVTGLLHLQILKARGSYPVIAITRSEEKLAMAASLGADLTAEPDAASAVVDEATDGQGVDVVIESVGKVATLSQAISLAGPGGRVLMYGTISEKEGALPFYELYYKEIDLISSRAAAPRDYQSAIDMVASGAVELAPLISASYPLSAATEAFDTMQTRRGVLKVILDAEA